MDREQRKIIENAFCGVLEKMAFVFAEPMHPPVDPPENEESYTLVSMRFGGVLHGSMELVLPDTVCAEVAANMVGCGDTPGAPGQTADAVKEVLNVTCGQILTDIAGERPMFDLSIPTARSMTGEEHAALLQDDQALAFSFEGSLGILCVRLEENG